MEVLRTWVLAVTAAALVIAVADALMPQGTVKQVGKLTGGLILVLVLLQPVAGLDYQILIEADFLVNLYEFADRYRAILAAEERIFRTASGKRLLHSIFGIEK